MLHPSDIFGLRVLARLGISNIVRFIVALLWLRILFATAAVVRDDLLHPADFGSDTSNYVAAGERAMSGSLYHLAPGDRPVPVDNPPDWSVAILSPPPVATVWSALSWAPDLVRFHLLWALGVGATCWLVLYFIVRLPLRLLLPVMYLFGAHLAIMAWSGNVNALVAPGLAIVWLLADSPRRHASLVAGAIVGASALVKLGPTFLGLWLMIRRHYRAVAAAIMTATIVVLATLVLVGYAEFVAYIDVARATARLPSPYSVPGWSATLGLPPEIGSLVHLLALGLASLATLALRDRPKITFTIMVFTGVMATTVVRPDTLVVGVAGLMPWVAPPSMSNRPRWFPNPVVLNGGIVLLVAALALVGAVATGGLDRSSMTITNLRPEPIVVRYSVPFQGATFGYRLEPGSTGVAWRDRMGRINGPAFVLSDTCRLLFRFTPRLDDATLAIGADGVESGRGVPSGQTPFLEYVPDCAVQVRAELAREP